jgi:hypothetical protein
MYRSTCLLPSPRPAVRHFLKMLLLLPVAGLFMACTSCSESPSTPPPPPIADLAPVGEGLKVVGFAMLGAAVVNGHQIDCKLFQAPGPPGLFVPPVQHRNRDRTRHHRRRGRRVGPHLRTAPNQRRRADPHDRIRASYRLRDGRESGRSTCQRALQRLQPPTGDCRVEVHRQAARVDREPRRRAPSRKDRGGKPRRRALRQGRPPAQQGRGLRADR